MDQRTWEQLTPAQREAQRDYSALTPQLVGLEGWRVAVTGDRGEQRRFIVGRSTGWVPIHLEVKTRRSYGGDPAEKHYQSIRKIEQVR